MSIGKFLCKINWTWGKWYLFHHVLHNIELSGMYFVFPWLIYMWCMCWITFIMSFKIVLVRNTHSVWCWTNCTVMKISAGKILRTPSWHGYIPSLKKLETQKKKKLDNYTTLSQQVLLKLWIFNYFKWQMCYLRIKMDKFSCCVWLY